jgi:hypothetical protein
MSWDERSERAQVTRADERSCVPGIALITRTENTASDRSREKLEAAMTTRGRDHHRGDLFPVPSATSASTTNTQRRVALHDPFVPPATEPCMELPFTRPVYFTLPTVNVISSPRSDPLLMFADPSVP